MEKSHHYSVEIAWTGNTGVGTNGYRSYERSHSISIENKVAIAGSSDAAFRGDKQKHTPEDLFVASIASCHMLWYLHLCSDAGVIVTTYVDQAKATMIESADGGGRFTAVTLYPQVTVTGTSMIAIAENLHKKANELCFIAQSLNFSVQHKPTVLVAKEA